MREWRAAPYSDRLATSADFVVTIMERNGATIPSFDSLKPQAIVLEREISDANRDGSMDSKNVSEVASVVSLLMRMTK